MGHDGFAISVILVVLAAVSWLPFSVDRLAFAQPAADETGDAVAVPASGDSMTADSWTAAEPKSRDPLKEVVERVIHRRYAYRNEVASGRFLEAFATQEWLLDDIELEKARLVRRQADWVRLEAPCSRARDFIDAPARRAEMRLVKRQGGWKLEDVKILRGES